MDKTSFVIYKDWYEVLRRKPADIRHEVLDAMCTYAFDGVGPEELSPMADGLFSMIQVQMDNNKEKFESVIEKRRAASRKAVEARIAKHNQTLPNVTKHNQTLPNVILNENENENVLSPIVDNDNNSSTTGDACAREKFFSWVKESDLAVWASRKIAKSGKDLNFYLREFYENDFTAREKTRRGERMEVLKHFQSWLPKYLNSQNQDGTDKQVYSEVARVRSRRAAVDAAIAIGGSVDLGF